MYAVVVQLSVKANRLAEFQQAILENAEASRTREPGCRRFDVCQSTSEPTEWVLYELYADEAAFAHHRAQPHFAAYSARAADLLERKVLNTYHIRSPLPASG